MRITSKTFCILPSAFCILPSAFCICLISLFLNSAFCILPSNAGLPLPGVVYYGQALNDRGWPLQRDADVALMVGGREVAVCPIGGMIAPGINFVLYAFIEDSEDGPAHPDAVQVGDAVQLVLRTDDAETPLFTNGTIPPIPTSGEVSYIKVTQGTSSGADGIPDAWKQELVAQSAGLYTNAESVLLADDLDGDGISNLDEYRACTSAYDANDYFAIDELVAAGSNRLAITFYTIPGLAYTLQQTGQDHSTWQKTPVALSELGAIDVVTIGGTGSNVTCYIEPDENVTAYRAVINK